MDHEAEKKLIIERLEQQRKVEVEHLQQQKKQEQDELLARIEKQKKQEQDELLARIEKQKKEEQDELLARIEKQKKLEQDELLAKIKEDQAKEMKIFLDRIAELEKRTSVSNQPSVTSAVRPPGHIVSGPPPSTLGQTSIKRIHHAGDPLYGNRIITQQQTNPRIPLLQPATVPNPVNVFPPGSGDMTTSKLPAVATLMADCTKTRYISKETAVLQAQKKIVKKTRYVLDAGRRIDDNQKLIEMSPKIHNQITVLNNIIRKGPYDGEETGKAICFILVFFHIKCFKHYSK